MKSTTLIIIIAIMVVIAGIFISSSSGTPSLTGKSIQGNDAQKITIGLKNRNYYPNTIKVKANQPVEITLDSTVGGCLRGFTINALGVSKYSADQNDKITFTPTQKGTFKFACTMGMGTGTIIVE